MSAFSSVNVAAINAAGVISFESSGNINSQTFFIYILIV